ncbi:hypothetical protein A0H81_08000 [Grifola frondosa]|uniref:Uncharacterized protein n=1 Tax=Grifola frondosa TaxID=5627 RepID=A0A1C7M7R7_GRIFR|nr:hypothetical protein A0H81_08000 [Grifola frondosa]
MAYRPELAPRVWYPRCSSAMFPGGHISFEISTQTSNSSRVQNHRYPRNMNAAAQQPKVKDVVCGDPSRWTTEQLLSYILSSGRPRADKLFVIVRKHRLYGESFINLEHEELCDLTEDTELQADIRALAGHLRHHIALRVLAPRKPRVWKIFDDVSYGPEDIATAHAAIAALSSATDDGQDAGEIPDFDYTSAEEDNRDAEDTDDHVEEDDSDIDVESGGHDDDDDADQGQDVRIASFIHARLPRAFAYTDVESDLEGVDENERRSGDERYDEAGKSGTSKIHPSNGMNCTEADVRAQVVPTQCSNTPTSWPPDVEAQEVSHEHLDAHHGDLQAQTLADIRGHGEDHRRPTLGQSNANTAEVSQRVSIYSIPPELNATSTAPPEDGDDFGPFEVPIVSVSGDDDTHLDTTSPSVVSSGFGVGSDVDEISDDGSFCSWESAEFLREGQEISITPVGMIQGVSPRSNNENTGNGDGNSLGLRVHAESDLGQDDEKLNSALPGARHDNAENNGVVSRSRSLPDIRVPHVTHSSAPARYSWELIHFPILQPAGSLTQDMFSSISSHVQPSGHDDLVWSPTSFTSSPTIRPSARIFRDDSTWGERTLWAPGGRRGWAPHEYAKSPYTVTRDDPLLSPSAASVGARRSLSDASVQTDTPPDLRIEAQLRREVRELQNQLDTLSQTVRRSEVVPYTVENDWDMWPYGRPF